ncbi:MAG: alpha-L-arabinofuranosidase AbfB [Promethearchaeota archaeon]
MGTISPNLYGHFAEHLGRCIYDGIWVGEDSPIPNEGGIRLDVVEALRQMRVPVLRWPGGCFADDYHWRDGVGPRDQRPTRTNLNWGGVETNQFGTHEFMALCEMLGAEPYVCGNMGSGTVSEMRHWLEYLNCEEDTTLTRLRAANGHPEAFGVVYWGIGNENWGCGGSMSPGHYAEEYKRYATFAAARNLYLYKVACGANGDDWAWTRKFFETIRGVGTGGQDKLSLVNGYAVHYYAGTSGNPPDTAVNYDEDQWYQLLWQAARIEALVEEHRRIMDEFDPTRSVGLIVDEWGAWHRSTVSSTERRELGSLYQQNTIRDALVAAVTLTTFNRRAHVVAMANLAQLVNVLQSPLLTKGDKLVRTPTFHAFEMMVPHHGTTSVRVDVWAPLVRFQVPEPPYYGPPAAGVPPSRDGRVTWGVGPVGTPPGSLQQVWASASTRGPELVVSLVNAHAREPVEVVLDARGVGGRTPRPVEWRSLAAPGGDVHARNDFNGPDVVRPEEVDPSEASGGVVHLPPASFHVLRFRLER